MKNRTWQTVVESCKEWLSSYYHNVVKFALQPNINTPHKHSGMKKITRLCSLGPSIYDIRMEEGGG